jgi:hypothetical protein
MINIYFQIKHNEVIIAIRKEIPTQIISFKSKIKLIIVITL